MTGRDVDLGVIYKGLTVILSNQKVSPISLQLPPQTETETEGEREGNREGKIKGARVREETDETKGIGEEGERKNPKMESLGRC